MTERLYYTDPTVTSFDATVQSVDRRDPHDLVTLDRTAFYPTSGGQPFDTGRLGTARVVDVVDLDDGSIGHLVEPGSGLAAGQRVHGEIDWTRRFDHMQQHTGQHVLSAACDRLSGARTVSFHLGGVTSTIDIARELTIAELAAVEDEANSVVWENRPVSIRFVTPQEAMALPLRKEPQRQGTLRLIDVERFDLSACGGTHVQRTGAIGIIAVVSWERFKGGQRIEFVCGRRALARFRSLRDAAAASLRLLSVAADEVPAAIERLQAETREQRRSIGALETELSRYRADAMAAEAEPAGDRRLVLRSLDTDANGLKTLASALIARPNLIVVLVSARRPALVVVARSGDVAIAANQLLRALTDRFGGRGGGRPELAQGGGLDGSPEEILALARSLV